MRWRTFPEDPTIRYPSKRGPCYRSSEGLAEVCSQQAGAGCGKAEKGRYHGNGQGRGRFALLNSQGYEILASIKGKVAKKGFDTVTGIFTGTSEASLKNTGRG